MSKNLKFAQLTCWTLFALLLNGQTNISFNAEIKSYLDDLTQDDFSGTILVAHNNQIIEKRANNQLMVNTPV